MPRHLRWPLAGMLCTKCATMKPISALKITAVIGEDAGLLDHQPEGFALEQELEVAEARRSAASTCSASPDAANRTPDRSPGARSAGSAAAPSGRRWSTCACMRLRRLERLRAGCAAATVRLQCDVSHDASSSRVSVRVRVDEAGVAPAADRVDAGGAPPHESRCGVRRSAPHEAFELAFRPGQRLLHRLALVDSARHILVRIAWV